MSRYCDTRAPCDSVRWYVWVSAGNDESHVAQVADRFQGVAIDDYKVGPVTGCQSSHVPAQAQRGGGVNRGHFDDSFWSETGVYESFESPGDAVKGRISDSRVGTEQELYATGLQ